MPSLLAPPKLASPPSTLRRLALVEAPPYVPGANLPTSTHWPIEMRRGRVKLIFLAPPTSRLSQHDLWISSGEVVFILTFWLKKIVRLLVELALAPPDGL